MNKFRPTEYGYDSVSCVDNTTYTVTSHFIRYTGSAVHLNGKCAGSHTALFYSKNSKHFIQLASFTHSHPHKHFSLYKCFLSLDIALTLRSESNLGLVFCLRIFGMQTRTSNLLISRGPALPADLQRPQTGYVWTTNE